MAEEKINIDEDPALIEWKKRKVNFNMKQFQREVEGRQGSLHVKMLGADYHASSLTLPYYLMTMSVSTDDSTDRIFDYPFEITDTARSIDSQSRKYGATSQSSWEFAKPNSLQMINEHYKKGYKFKLIITRADKFQYHLKNGNIPQAVLGFIRNK